MPGSSDTETWLALANDLLARGRHREAARAYAAVLALDPSSHGVYNNLGVARRKRARSLEAAILFRHALSLDPTYAGAANNLGNALLASGRAEAALDEFRRATVLAPRNRRFLDQFIVCLNLSERAGPADLLKAGRHWHERFTDPRPASSHLNDRSPDRCLRIGYLSGRMFRDHTLSRVMMPIIAGHDSANVDVTIYSDLAPAKEDAISKRFAHHVRWQRTGALSDKALAQQIRRDRIDVLVGATGFFSDARLVTFGDRPAPIQVAFPPATAYGGPTFDYILADPYLLPDSLEPYIVEQIERIPFAYCFDPLCETPEPASPPAVARRYVTFGSMNSLNKIGDSAIRAWSRILAAVPQSRLLIKTSALQDPDLAEPLLRRFADHGIAPNRIALRAWAPNYAAHLAVYNEIDIALDSFPYVGVTTTCEALWMGVPVVTLAGNRILGRYGVTLLNAVGFPEGIAESEDDYVVRAVSLASDMPRLVELRRLLPQMMAGSPLCDGRAAAREIEAAYRRMWRRWCEGG